MPKSSGGGGRPGRTGGGGGGESEVGGVNEFNIRPSQTGEQSLKNAVLAVSGHEFPLSIDGSSFSGGGKELKIKGDTYAHRDTLKAMGMQFVSAGKVGGYAYWRKQGMTYESFKAHLDANKSSYKKLAEKRANIKLDFH
jgi:hypothetical protein